MKDDNKNKIPPEVTLAELEACYTPEYNTELYEILENLESGAILIDEAYKDILNTGIRFNKDK